jgi:hypothetical protein
VAVTAAVVAMGTPVVAMAVMVAEVLEKAMVEEVEAATAVAMAEAAAEEGATVDRMSQVGEEVGEGREMAAEA